MNKTICVALSALLFFCIPADAQQRVHRIAYLSSGKASPSSDPRLNVFRQRLRELEYIEGQNLLIEYRYAELDQPRLPDLAADLVRLSVDVILTSPDEPVIRAAQEATRTIPVVMPGIVVDPLEPTFWGEKQRAPLVVSLAKPGGNFTGLTNLDPTYMPRGLGCSKNRSRISFGLLFFGRERSNKSKRSRISRPSDKHWALRSSHWQRELWRISSAH
jgi:ABC-type uncharacterized transport system substrate-binding protein